MFIDSHAHIDGPEFEADREEVIERAQAVGVSVILNVGTGDHILNCALALVPAWGADSMLNIPPRDSTR